jgi:hypothetical protein
VAVAGRGAGLGGLARGSRLALVAGGPDAGQAKAQEAALGPPRRPRWPGRGPAAVRRGPAAAPHRELPLEQQRACRLPHRAGQCRLLLLAPPPQPAIQQCRQERQRPRDGARLIARRQEAQRERPQLSRGARPCPAAANGGARALALAHACWLEGADPVARLQRLWRAGAAAEALVGLQQAALEQAGCSWVGVGGW